MSLFPVHPTPGAHPGFFMGVFATARYRGFRRFGGYSAAVMPVSARTDPSRDMAAKGPILPQRVTCAFIAGANLVRPAGTSAACRNMSFVGTVRSGHPHILLSQPANLCWRRRTAAHSDVRDRAPSPGCRRALQPSRSHGALTKLISRPDLALPWEVSRSVCRL
jgi:hypothetical protein